MKGLLLKDFYALGKQGKVIAAVMGIYLVIFVPQGNVSMVSFMMVMFSMMCVINSMAYDETQKWDRYALSVACDRKQLVRSKYLLGLILMLACMVLALPLYGVARLFGTSEGFGETMLVFFCVMLVTLIITAILVPLIYKYGVEKSRLMMMAAIMVPVLAIILLAKVVDLDGLIARYAGYLYLLPVVLAVVALTCYAVSYRASLRIFSRKEL